MTNFVNTKQAYLPLQRRVILCLDGTWEVGNWRYSWVAVGDGVKQRIFGETWIKNPQQISLMSGAGVSLQCTYLAVWRDLQLIILSEVGVN